MYPARISVQCAGLEDRATLSPDTSGSAPIVQQILVGLDQRAGTDFLDYEYRLADVALVGEYSCRLVRTMRRDDDGHWVRDSVW